MSTLIVSDSADFTGHGTPDMQIALAGTLDLVAGDFIL